MPIWVHLNSAIWPNSTGARLWFPAESIDVSQDYMYYATVLAHELCHYLYDLRDEYNNGTSCQGDIATQASMFAIDGDLTPAEAAAAITEALIEIAGESRENGGIVSFQDVDGVSVPAIAEEDPSRPPFAWTPEGEKPARPKPGKPIESFRFLVQITSGNSHCTLGALWKCGSKPNAKPREASACSTERR